MGQIVPRAATLTLTTWQPAEYPPPGSSCYCPPGRALSLSSYTPIYHGPGHLPTTGQQIPGSLSHPVSCDGGQSFSHVRYGLYLALQCPSLSSRYNHTTYHHTGPFLLIWWARFSSCGGGLSLSLILAYRAGQSVSRFPVSVTRF